MKKNLNINVPIKPVLDHEFIPAKLWNDSYRDLVAEEGGVSVIIYLQQNNGNVFSYKAKVLELSEGNEDLSVKYIERLVKFLLWQKGGCRITIEGNANVVDPLVSKLKAIYSSEGKRSFDCEFIGSKIYGKALEIEGCSEGSFALKSQSKVSSLGRNLEGCRIGFDLGGSDRKCAALIDGKVVYSEEITWDPYFQSDHNYHYEGIQNSLKNAAAHLPRVDAIGGSAAGVYVDTEVRAGSLFRGVSDEDFEKHVQRIFFKVKEDWGNVPFDVVNDGEVTALAGSMSIGKNAVLGISLGTSQAVGYVNSDGFIEPWLNELAFAPVDYREEVAQDEWSGDFGCGVQYFSQQAINRLLKPAGIDLSDEMPFPEKLKAVQALMIEGDERAKNIYQTIGAYLGYSLLHYAEFYEIENLLLLGRVTTGEGGDIIINEAKRVLKTIDPAFFEKLRFSTPSETDKRHGQAIAAASLPKI